MYSRATYSAHLTAEKAVAYRYAFNGQERDNEVAGSGNSYTAVFWQYDARLGRRWNMDQVAKPTWSSYACLGNNPIVFVDIGGDDWYWFDNRNSFEKLLGLNKKDKKLVWSYEKIKDRNHTHAGEVMTLELVLEVNENRYWRGAAILNQTLLNTYLAVFDEDNYNNMLSDLDKYGKYEDIDFGDDRFYPVGKKPKERYSNMLTAFRVNEELPVEDFYDFVMGSFITGNGPEDLYFGPETPISQSLETSLIVRTAMEKYNAGDEAATSGNWFEVDVGEGSAYEFAVFGLIEQGTVLTPEHLIGSAMAKLSLNEDGTVRVTIFNPTSLGSGLLDMPSYKRPQDDKNHQFTNVSQTYELDVNPNNYIKPKESEGSE